MATLTYTDRSPVATMASLADAAFVTSAAIDNEANDELEAYVQVKIKTGTSVDAAGHINVYLVASADGGTTFDDSAAGRAQLLFSFPANADSTTYIASSSTGPTGLLPDQYKIAVENQTGAALTSTEGDHDIIVIGIDVS